MKPPSTLVLTRRDIARTMRLTDYIEAVAQAFARSVTGRATVPPVVHLPGSGGVVHVKSAGFPGEPGYMAVKVNANFPENRERHGLPTIQGAIVLCDGSCGALLALMDSAEVTTMRTAAATAVAARHLAKPDTTVATVIGCGVQGPVQALALREVLPIETVYLYDADRSRSKAAAQRLAAEPGLRAEAVERFDEAARRSGAIVTCTSSQKAFLSRDHVSPGTFIAAVGADNHDKQELEPDLLCRARVVVDVLEQCAEIGELHHALEAGCMTRSAVFSELGPIVAGARRPSFGADEIVVFDSTGTALQDVAAAGVIYERAREAGLGLTVELP